MIIKRDRVVETKLDSLFESSIHRELNRVERAPACAELLCDGSVAAEPAHQVGDDCARARRCAGGETAILILLLERGAKINSVDVDALQGTVAVLADTFDVEK